MSAADGSTDPHAWLEDVDGEEALAWVRARNAEKAQRLATDSFALTKSRILEVLDSDAKIPYVTRRGDHYYNFWTDAEHERGLWRRTPVESYRDQEPAWETLLDVDALNAAEGENWVWHGANVWRGDPSDEADAYRFALVELSRGGSDADVTREFDLQTKTFVENGFYRPEAKGGSAWIDRDTVLVCTDFGEGSLTASGYPRVVRRWRRGTPLHAARTLFEGKLEDVAVAGSHDTTPGFERTFLTRRISFWTGELYLLGDDDALTMIDTPLSAEEGVHREWLTVELRQDWAVGGTTYPAGALLAARLADVLSGSRDFQVLYSPTPTSSLAGSTWTRNHLVLTILQDVTNLVEVLTPGPDGVFTHRGVEGLSGTGTITVSAVDARDRDDVWVTSTDFLTPTTLSLATITEDGRLGAGEALKSMPRFFDAEGLATEQHFATSADGTGVPYFVVRRADRPRDGSAPTLLYAYGGFEVSLTPSYSGALGRAWLERGGVYVSANIRGGGEYGPRWHQAALRAERHRCYEDLAAVARDLVARGITSAAHLGVQGGSNGGLMAGNMLVRHPELFGAVVIEVPLLDMKRYSHLLAGASWVAEYGDPDDPRDWEFLRTFSPYHLFDPSADYPPVLFTTSTRDDRVHPAHARKMAALMLTAGKDVTYYENIEGGHGGAASNEQAAHLRALSYEFLWERLAGSGAATPR